MAPRKPLTQVSANTPPAPQRTAGKASRKTKKQEAHIQQENDDLKAQLADLTSQLEQAKLEPKDPPSVPTTEKTNPFGGSLPVAVPFASLGVAPRRPLTAFQRFCQDTREDLKKSMPTANVHEVNAKLGQLWKAQSAEEQTVYKEKVEQDRLRYSREMEAFNQQKEKAEVEKLAMEYWSQELKQKKAMEFYEAHLAKMKDSAGDKPGIVAPKQARNAYNFFAASRHKELAKNGASLGESAGKISEEWNKLQSSKGAKNKELLRKFQRMAVEDETRYEQELEEYHRKLNEISQKQAQEREEFRKAALEAYAKKTSAAADAKAFRKIQAMNQEAEKLERKKAREEKQAAKAAKADEPTRPRNAYALFFADKAAEVSEYVKTNNVEHSMAKEIAERWKALGDAAKNKYKEAAENDRVRYEKETQSKGKKAGNS